MNPRPWKVGITEKSLDMTLKSAILFKWPQGKPVFPNLRAADGTTVRMLDIETDQGWQQTLDGLELDVPPSRHHSGHESEIPCDHA